MTNGLTLASPRVKKRYDVFTFFNELDLLEIRLHILDPFVDYFVLIEATETFSGQPKKLIFKENQQRFAKFLPKIIHFAIHDVPATEHDFQKRLEDQNLDPLSREIIHQALSSDNVPKGQLHWLKEFFQKESIRKALVGLPDDAECFISDVDEIWNPMARLQVADDKIYKLRQLVYAYFLNNRSNEPWAGTLVTQYRNIRNACLNHLRTATKTPYTYINDGGWHFTNMGGAEKIAQKIESYGHQEFNNTKIKSQLAKRIAKNQDFIGRSFTFWIDDTQLPPYLHAHKSTYPHLFSSQPNAVKPRESHFVIKVHGGLGNQLFQYAFGKAVAQKQNVQVAFDISWYAQQKDRQFLLPKFNCPITLATESEITYFSQFRKRTGKLRLLHNLFRANPKKYVQEKTFRFNPQIFAVQAGAYFDGYWQSEKYFIDMQQQIREELQVRQLPTGENAALLDEIRKNNAIAVHVRRGDYVQNSAVNAFHGTTPLPYYQQAAALILQRVPEPIFYVFSDDPPWVKKNLLLPGTTVYVTHNGEAAEEDLRLMQNCKHHIIANSTFSWWGAWLAYHPKQIVIAPRKWFNNPQQDDRDLVPENWIRM